MLITVMNAKIHRATVTDANLNYVGSITIDPALLDATGILEGEQVDVVDVTNGARITTYTICGKRHSGEVTINGAAAHLISPGDIIIIISYRHLRPRRAKKHRPSVVFVDGNNNLVNET